METALAFALLQGVSMAIFGVFSFLMASVVLERKYSRKKTAFSFLALIALIIAVVTPIRYYVANRDVNHILNVIPYAPLSDLAAAFIEISAILITTVLVCAFVMHLYSEKKKSLKLFIVSFTSLISLIICSFISDYAMFALNYFMGLTSGTIEYTFLYLIPQTILVIAGFIIYYVWIRKSLNNLISSTNGDMRRFVIVPIVSYIFFVMNYCVWYIVPDVLNSDMRLQYLLISSILPILYIIMFRLIFIEISSAAESMRMETEMNAARSIQASILPPLNSYESRGMNIASTMSPAMEVGGDFYDFFRTADGKMALMIADVSGKGVPAAFFMMRAHTIIKSNLMAFSSPAEALTKSNADILENNDACMFVTVFAAVLDPETGKLIYSCAGHNPPLIKNKISGYLNIDKMPVLGITPVTYKDMELTLTEGSTLLLYTDGVTEAMSAEGEEYGTERLAKLIDNSKSLEVCDLIRDVSEDLQSFSGMPNDDITMLALEYTGDFVKLTVPADEEYLETVQSAVLDLADTNDAKLKSSLLIVVEEVFMNIVKYAYPNSDGKVCIMIKSHEQLEIRFEDVGIKFNPLENKDPDITSPLEERTPGGYGIYMTKHLVDEVLYEYQNGKNVFVIKKMMQ